MLFGEKRICYCAPIRAISGLYADEVLYSRRTIAPNGGRIPRSSMETKHWYKVFAGHAETILYYATLACLGECRHITAQIETRNYDWYAETGKPHPPGCDCNEHRRKYEAALKTWIDAQMILSQEDRDNFRVIWNPRSKYSGFDPRYQMLVDFLHSNYTWICEDDDDEDSTNEQTEERDEVYAISIPSNQIAPILNLCTFAFAKAQWDGSYGGKRWANCSASAERLSRVLSSGSEIQEIIIASDRVVNAVHNGGYLLNKFNRCGKSLEQVINAHVSGDLGYLTRQKEQRCETQESKKTWRSCLYAKASRKISGVGVGILDRVSEMYPPDLGRLGRAKGFDLVEI